MEQQIQLNVGSPALLGAGKIVFADCYGMTMDVNPCFNFGRMQGKEIQWIASVEFMREVALIIPALRVSVETRFKMETDKGGFSPALPVAVPPASPSDRYIINFVAACVPSGEPEITFSYYTLRFLNEAGVAKQGLVNIAVPTALTLRTTKEVEISFFSALIKQYS